MKPQREAITIVLEDALSLSVRNINPAKHLFSKPMKKALFYFLLV